MNVYLNSLSKQLSGLISNDPSDKLHQQYFNESMKRSLQNISNRFKNGYNEGPRAHLRSINLAKKTQTYLEKEFSTHLDYLQRALTEEQKQLGYLKSLAPMIDGLRKNQSWFQTYKQKRNQTYQKRQMNLAKKDPIKYIQSIQGKQMNFKKNTNTSSTNKKDNVIRLYTMAVQSTKDKINRIQSSIKTTLENSENLKRTTLETSKQAEAIMPLLIQHEKNEMEKNKAQQKMYETLRNQERENALEAFQLQAKRMREAGYQNEPLPNFMTRKIHREANVPSFVRQPVNTTANRGTQLTQEYLELEKERANRANYLRGEFNE
jgi:hypothetical protein